MDHAERQQKIESYGAAYTQLVDALQTLPKEMWHFKPAPDEWSVHQIVVHIADSEAFSFSRFRKMVVEPGSAIVGYDQALWAKVLRYDDQSMEDALELFRFLRGNTYKLIKLMPPEVWTHTYYHPERKNMVSMDDWLLTYENHIPLHIRQMQANNEVWQAKK